MDISELRSEVAERYERLGLPSWPDPHPHLTPPKEEEYSRVTDGGRYRIVHARMRIWADVLTELLDGVGTEPLRGADLADGGRPWSFDSGVRIAASRPGTLPVVLLERTVPPAGDDGGLPVAQIASVWPGPALACEPGCGCDACDDGSAYYLEQIDDAIAGLVGGPTVILQGAGWHHIWQPRAGSGSGHPTVQDPRGQCASLARGEEVKLPPGVEAYVGRSWLG